MRRYSEEEIHTITENLLRVYPPEKLRKLHDAFTWDKQILPGAWTARTDLQEVVTASTDLLMSTTAAQKVYQWGFNKRPFRLLNSVNYQTAVHKLIRTFIAARDYRHLENPLIDALSLKRVGIATASKWACFCDQRRYAIYDSRVSVALIEVHVDPEHRAFPIVARRKSQRHIPYPADPFQGDSGRVARAYLDYLRVLAEASKKAALMPAQIEMALFMAGDRSYEGKRPSPLRVGMWIEKGHD